MELVRDVVKIMEEGMMENFDDEASKPVSAAFPAPSQSDQQTPLEEKPVATRQDKFEDAVYVGDAGATQIPTIVPRGGLHDPIVTRREEIEEPESLNDPTTPLATVRDALETMRRTATLPRRMVSFDPIQLSPHQPDDDLPIIEVISQDAIEELVRHVFMTADAQDAESIRLDQFRVAVQHDLNILAWFESLGSIF